jgi:hypothetical protein
MSAGSAASMMQGLTQEMDQMAMMPAEMQVEQSMYSSVSNVAESGASNAKAALRGS